MSRLNPQKPEEALLSLRVVPRASKAKLGRDDQGQLKAWVTAPPVDGEANEAVCLLLAKTLDVPRSKVEVVSGHAHRSKTLKITGLCQVEVDRRLKEQ
jgi:uncharacterized protein